MPDMRWMDHVHQKMSCGGTRMSYVTSVVLHVDLSEDGFDCDDNLEHGRRLRSINIWLRELGFGPLKELGDGAGGNKNAQVYIYCAAYNHFEDEKFLEYVKEIKFGYPEQAILLMTSESNPTVVYRPSYDRTLR